MNSYLSIAQDLCDGLDNDIEDIARRLKKLNKSWHISLFKLNEKCWADSTKIFDKIYAYE